MWALVSWCSCQGSEKKITYGTGIDNEEFNVVDKSLIWYYNMPINDR